MFTGTLAKESIGKKILILITGYKVNIAKLKAKWHVFPMEDVEDSEENGLERKLVVVPHDEGEIKLLNAYPMPLKLEKSILMCGQLLDYPC